MKKTIKVILRGLASNVLHPVKLDICVEEASTIADIIQHLTELLGKEQMGQTAEYYYRHQGDFFVLTVDNKYLDRELWSVYVPKDGNTLVMIPPLSDG